jgi:hypothetical protein
LRLDHVARFIINTTLGQRAAVLIFSSFPLRLKPFDVTARKVITILRQKISDAEQAGVREVPLSNLRRLIDQIEQGLSGDPAKTPRGTRNGNSQPKFNTSVSNGVQRNENLSRVPLA